MNKKETHRVPWEPYRGAINGQRLTKGRAKDPVTLNTALAPLNSFEKEDLVRYKVETDLNIFNAQRPGYLFDASDYERIDKQAFAETDMLSSLIATNGADEAKSRPAMTPFTDARFYDSVTDVHFLKLANELKKKCVSPNAKSTGAIKPVNVVGPMVDKKPKNAALGPGVVTESSSENSGAVSGRSSAPSFDGNSLKIWKSQRSQYESRIEYLESQINGLNEQLQIQTQVNAELKRMLVASVGEDMQYRLERLVNDKQRLEFELINNNANLDRMADEIEQISIQCDLWRSKFLASKLMLDELSTW